MPTLRDTLDAEQDSSSNSFSNSYLELPKTFRAAAPFINSAPHFQLRISSSAHNSRSELEKFTMAS